MYVYLQLFLLSFQRGWINLIIHLIAVLSDTIILTRLRDSKKLILLSRRFGTAPDDVSLRIMLISVLRYIIYIVFFCAEVPFSIWRESVNPSIAQKYEELYIRLLSKEADTHSTEKKRKRIMGEHLMDWQMVIFKLAKEPNPAKPLRSVSLWVTDRVGGKGKSRLRQVIAVNTPTVFILSADTKANMADCFRRQQEALLPIPVKNVIFDLPKATIESPSVFIELFQFIEFIIDGTLPCYKYNTKNIELDVQVFVFSNNSYDDFRRKTSSNLLSEDRVRADRFLDLEEFPLPDVVNENPLPTVSQLFASCTKRNVNNIRFRPAANMPVNQQVQPGLNQMFSPQFSQDSINQGAVYHSQMSVSSRSDSIHIESPISHDEESSVGSFIDNASQISNATANGHFPYVNWDRDLDLDNL